MAELKFRARPAQKSILAYHGGRMGVSAVPGSGKTYILSILAAQLVSEAIDNDQEVLIVTLVNSAVENIKRRIAEHIGHRGLLANVGYRVRTLHGLAHDIVRERPGLVGLADDFHIVDERVSEQIREDVVEVWLRGHPNAADAFLSLDLRDTQREWAAREWAAQTQWPDAVRNLVSAFIKRAKDLSFSPEQLLEDLASHKDDPTLDLARMGAQIYADYQKSLYYRGNVDFDDLIRLAQVALQQDDELLARLRHRWPFILEDEAQDSSSLQEKILRLLVGPTGNWVRVGDPNQAINTTFTTADPRFLHKFLQEQGVTSLPLDSSGRSQQCIIDLANFLVEWTVADHPEQRVRSALSSRTLISPTLQGDPQPNPATNVKGVYLLARKYTPDKEIDAVVRSLARWLPEHPDDTVAVLVPRNQRGFQITDALKRADLPYIELLRSTTSTRETAGALGNVLKYLANPLSAPLLARVFTVWRRQDREEKALAERARRLSTLIRRCRYVEEYLWPRLGDDWLDRIEWTDKADQVAQIERAGVTSKDQNTPLASDRTLLTTFRDIVRRWQRATILPIDQLTLTIARDLFIEPNELALSHKLAVMLRSVSETNPDWRLAELTTELAVIAKNQRRFLGFDDEDGGFQARPGQVTVSTLHKAKGLEWDRVYLMSVNNYNFPSAQPYDEYISEKWFIRDQLNLEAEALEQLESLDDTRSYQEGHATRQARLEYVAERLRLLYVGISRARKELVLTWNTGRSREAKQMAVPFIALQTWWEEKSLTYA
jgi:DNA helicase-2/ATP-dependent DNA helicase PcrA